VASGPRARGSRCSQRPCDVNAVVEINEIGQLVDARPLQRLAGAVAGANGLKHRSVRQICEWQFMHVLVGGMPAKLDCSPKCGSSGSRCQARSRGAGG